MVIPADEKRVSYRVDLWMTKYFIKLSATYSANIELHYLSEIHFSGVNRVPSGLPKKCGIFRPKCGILKNSLNPIHVT